MGSAPTREEAVAHLDPERTRRVRLLCRTGYVHFDADDPARALRHFYRAWLLLPRPQRQCIESGWILTAIGEAYLRLADYRSAAEALRSALHCPEIAGNPSVHDRLAQCCAALGQSREAESHRAIAQRGRSGRARPLSRR